MKRFFLAFFVCAALISPAKAIAPVIAFAVTTSAGTTSVASAATTAVGLVLTAAAIAKSIFFPTKINFPTKPESYDPSSGYPSITFESNSSYTNTCQVLARRIAIRGTNVVSYDWTFRQTTSCNSATYATSKHVCDGLNSETGVCSVEYIDHFKFRCTTTAGCGPIARDQEAIWAQYQVFEDEKMASGLGGADETISITRSSGLFSYDLRDVDVPSSVGGESGFPVTTSSGLAFQFTNDAQQMSVITVNPSPLGTTITEYNQTSPETYQKSELQVDTAGVIQSGSSTSSSGVVNPVPSSPPNVSVVYQPVTSTSPETDPGTGTGTQFPSDYARAGEAAAAAQNVVDGLLSGEFVTPEVPDEQMPWFGSTFDGVLPTINTAGATCPVWQFDALGESFYIDHHCQLIVDFNALFYAMFTAFWVLLAFRTVLEA
jgi:hypothetical protein